MKSSKVTYIIYSSIIVGGFSILAAIVSLRIFSADQLAPPTKWAVCVFIWGIISYLSYLLVVYYKKLDQPGKLD